MTSGTCRTRPATASGGYSLVELMVVVAIIGVLASLAVSGGPADPELEKTANSLALRIADVSRQARSAGPVVDSVAEEEGDTSRARLQIARDEGGQFFAVDLRVEEDALSSAYLEQSRTYVSRDTIIYGVESGVARTAAGGNVTELPDDYELLCAPSGACGPVTLYLKSIAGPEAKFRVVVLPLSGQPLVMSGW